MNGLNKQDHYDFRSHPSSSPRDLSRADQGREAFRPGFFQNELTPDESMPTDRVRGAVRLGKIQKRTVLALWKINRRLVDEMREKDQVIAWLSGCYSVNEYTRE